jgi:superfamily II DNA helicase RecQ
MKDQVDALTRLGIDAARLDSSLDKDEVGDIHRRVRSGALRLLYVAPERFANERFLELLQQLLTANRKFAHMRDVKQASPLAYGLMLLGDAIILNWHLPT